MPTVMITPSVTSEQATAALRDEFGESKVALSHKHADTITVQGNAFARASVRLQQTGESTSFDVRPAPIGPIGLVVSALWFTRRVARAIDDAPKLHGSA